VVFGRQHENDERDEPSKRAVTANPTHRRYCRDKADCGRGRERPVSMSGPSRSLLVREIAPM
jgi:hypothetical protein